MSSNSSYLWSVILQTVSGQVRQSFFRISLRTTHRHRTILSNHFTLPPSSPVCINLHHVLYQFVISIHFWHFPIVYIINLDLFCVQSQRQFFWQAFTILHLFIHTCSSTATIRKNTVLGSPANTTHDMSQIAVWAFALSLFVLPFHSIHLSSGHKVVAFR